jgi:sugar (pentulose or hexulose) kinase
LIKKTNVQVQKHAPLDAICFSILGEAITPVDRSGQPLDRTLVSMDYRGKKQSQRIAKTLGAENIYAHTGQVCHPMYPLSKILWWQEECPHIFSNTWKFLCWEDLLALKLCGTATMSHSLASRTMGFDIRRTCWSEEILSPIGLSEELFADPVPSGTPINAVSSAMCETLGLPRKTLLVAGGWDQACAALGAGIIDENVFLESLGTTICVGMFSNTIMLQKELFRGGYQTTCFVKDGTYFLNGGTLNGGLLIKWFRERLNKELDDRLSEEQKDFYEHTIEKLDFRLSSLYFIPHFAGSGTPDFHADAQGGLLNLSYEHDAQDILQALLESLGFEVRKNLDFLEQRLSRTFREIRFVGGGSRSEYLCKLTSTISRKPIKTFDFYDVASFGAAILALAGTEGWDSALSILQNFAEKFRQYDFHEVDFEDKYDNYKRLSKGLHSLIRMSQGERK